MHVTDLMISAIAQIRRKKLEKILDNKDLSYIQGYDLWITKRCNAKCFFCPVIHSISEKADLSYDEVKKISLKMQEDFPNISSVGISGGEPLLHKDFERIIHFIKSDLKIPQIIVYTNGALLDKINEATLKEIDEMYISLHSLSHYKDIFGTKSLNHVLKNIKLLDGQNKEKTILSIGLSKINEESFEEVLRFAIEEGVKNIDIFPIRFEFSSSYRLAKNLHLLEQKLNWDRIIEVIKSYHHELNIHPSIRVLKNFQIFYTKKKTWKYPCSSPFHRLIVDYEGKLRLCCGDLPPLGNLLEENNVRDMLLKESTLKYLHMALYRKGVCKNCVFAPDPDPWNKIKNKTVNMIKGAFSKESEV